MVSRAHTPDQRATMFMPDSNARLAALEEKVASLEGRVPEDRVSLVVFSWELDRLLAAFAIATGATALGYQTSMFFMFWGLAGLRQKKVVTGKRLRERLVAMLTPGNSRQLPMSRMNFFGVGAKMLRGMMRDKHVASLEDLMRVARRMGTRIIACETSRDVMGIRDEELVGELEFGAASSFLPEAFRSRVTLFI
ncbi:MAG TPA: DsrE/DsrF/DrsH-like family protein [Candidatus Dormibacteraeota bacterium]|nr:DsrE/DsrF/DrsH-like family protein [Candidatus Dormibacteraeota bacterium]